MSRSFRKQPFGCLEHKSCTTTYFKKRNNKIFRLSEKEKLNKAIIYEPEDNLCPIKKKETTPSWAYPDNTKEFIGWRNENVNRMIRMK